MPKPLRRLTRAQIVRKLRLRSMQEVDAIVGDYYSDRRLENGKRWLVEQLLAEANAKQ